MISADPPGVARSPLDHLRDTAAVALLSAAGVAGVAAAAAWTFRRGPTAAEAARSSIYYPIAFAPEPGERAAYLAAIAVLLVLPVFVSRWVNGMGSRTREGLARAAAAAGALLLLASARGWPAYIGLSPLAFCVTASAAAAVAFLALLGDGRRLEKSLLAACVALLCVAAIQTTRGESDVTESWTWTHHFGHFFSAVVQAASGRTLLSDFADTYGLYAQALGPVASAVRPNLLAMTAVLSLLGALGLAALLALVWSVVRRPAVAFLVFMSVLYWHVLAGRLSWSPYEPTPFDAYFQGMPLRTLFPQVALLLFWRWVSGGGLQSPWGLASLAAAAILWNPDSGLATFGALFAGVAFEKVRQRCHVRGIVRALLPFGAAPLVALVAYAAFAFVRSGRLPDFRLLTAAPRAFFGSGFMMVPMPLLHPWLLVAAVYVLAISSGVLRVVCGTAERIDALTASAAVLGMLLFAYYQGRSADSNLPPVVYPAILITGIALDRFVDSSAVRTHRLLRSATLLLLVFFAFAPAAIVTRGRRLLLTTTRTFEHGSGVSRIRTSAAFAARWIPRGSEALVLSHMAWYLHWYTGSRSPLRWTGLPEIVWKRDFDEITRTVASRRFRYVVVDADFVNYPYAVTREQFRLITGQDTGPEYPGISLPPLVRGDVVAAATTAIRENYRLVAVSPDGWISVAERLRPPEAVPPRR